MRRPLTRVVGYVRVSTAKQADSGLRRWEGSRPGYAHINPLMLGSGMGCSLVLRGVQRLPWGFLGDAARDLLEEDFSFDSPGHNRATWHLTSSLRGSQLVVRPKLEVLMSYHGLGKRIDAICANGFAWDSGELLYVVDSTYVVWHSDMALAPHRGRTFDVGGDEEYILSPSREIWDYLFSAGSGPHGVLVGVL